MKPAWRAVLVAMAACGCVQSSYNLATRDQDYSLTSTSKEVAVGRRIAHRIAEELPIADDESLQERVRSIGNRIVAVCDRQELVYSFTVVNDEDVNAFSLPGGYVFINDGLIAKTSTDDELAGVIAHEVAHIAARHAVKRFEGGLGLQIAQLATMAARQGEAARGLGVAARAAQLAYARQDELEADRLGVKYLKAAGFDPHGVLTFLEKLRELHHGKLHYLPRGVTRPQYAMTHPYVPERLRTVKESLYGVADYMDYLNTPD
jgi:predicted Zn-dependent protease